MVAYHWAIHSSFKNRVYVVHALLACVDDTVVLFGKARHRGDFSASLQMKGSASHLTFVPPGSLNVHSTVQRVSPKPLVLPPNKQTSLEGRPFVSIHFLGAARGTRSVNLPF